MYTRSRFNSDPSGLHFSFILNTFSVHFESILVTFWLHVGSFWVPFWSLSRSILGFPTSPPFLSLSWSFPAPPRLPFLPFVEPNIDKKISEKIVQILYVFLLILGAQRAPKIVLKIIKKCNRFSTDFLGPFRMPRRGPIPLFLQYLPCEIKVFGFRPNVKFQPTMNKNVIKNGTKMEPKSFKNRSKNQAKNESDFEPENEAKMAPKMRPGAARKQPKTRPEKEAKKR